MFSFCYKIFNMSAFIALRSMLYYFNLIVSVWSVFRWIFTEHLILKDLEHATCYDENINNSYFLVTGNKDYWDTDYQKTK